MNFVKERSVIIFLEKYRFFYGNPVRMTVFFRYFLLCVAANAKFFVFV